MNDFDTFVPRCPKERDQRTGTNLNCTDQNYYVVSPLWLSMSRQNARDRAEFLPITIPSIAMRSSTQTLVTRELQSLRHRRRPFLGPIIPTVHVAAAYCPTEILRLSKGQELLFRSWGSSSLTAGAKMGM